MRWKKTSTTSAIGRRLCSTAIPGWIRTRPTFRARRAILKPTRLSWRKRARSSSSTWKAVFWRWRAIRLMIPMRLSSAAMRRPISCWIPRNPLVNYAIGSRDPPGSIFKMVTATAGLLNGQLTLAEQISDGGRFDKYDQTNPPRCWLNQNRLSLHANQSRRRHHPFLQLLLLHGRFAPV